MVEALNVGPLLVPTWPAAVLLGLVIAILVAGRLARRTRLDRSWLLSAAEGTGLVGVVGARLGYVAVNWSEYGSEPWTALYLWQPGYSAIAGVAVGAGYALWRIARRPESTRWRYLAALCMGFGVGAAALAVMIVALHVFAPPSLLGRGDRVPDFTLEDLDGNRVALSDLSGRGIVINFWATWCPPCRREMPLLDAVHAEYASQGLSVVGVSVGESAAVVSPFVERLGIRYLVLVEPAAAGPAGGITRALHQRFGGVGLPTTVFVGRDGVVQDVYVGELGRAYLVERVRSILSH